MPESKPQHAIECMSLTRRFGSFTAVNGLSLKVKKGELFGFLGPNGAGKTTTINMLTTLLSPSGGAAKVASFDLSRQPALVRSRIGVVPQQFSLFEELTPMENLWYIGELYEMDKDVMRQRSEEILKIVTLYDKRDVQSGTFSGGMKQRLSVARAFVTNPEILLMDEPFSSLDEITAREMRNMLLQLWERRKKTIVFVTHNMFEAAFLSDRILLMTRRPGKIYRTVVTGLPRPRNYEDPNVFAVSVNVARDFLRDIGADRGLEERRPG